MSRRRPREQKLCRWCREAPTERLKRGSSGRHSFFVLRRRLRTENMGDEGRSSLVEYEITLIEWNCFRGASLIGISSLSKSYPVKGHASSRISANGKSSDCRYGPMESGMWKIISQNAHSLLISQKRVPICRGRTHKPISVYTSCCVQNKSDLPWT